MGLIRYSWGHISGPMNRFPPNLGCGCFSSCSTSIWYPKCWNAIFFLSFFFFFLISSLLYSNMKFWHVKEKKKSSQYLSFSRFTFSNHSIERRCFPSAVGTKQSHHFSMINGQRHIAHSNLDLFFFLLITATTTCYLCIFSAQRVDGNSRILVMGFKNKVITNMQKTHWKPSLPFSWSQSQKLNKLNAFPHTRCRVDELSGILVIGFKEVFNILKILCGPRTTSVACRRGLWMMQVNIWPWSPHLLG